MSTAKQDVLVEAQNISLERSGRQILDRVNLHVSKGEIVTLVGPNGAGKTSLVKILLGVMKPDSGKVMPKPDLKIGYVPQKFEIDYAFPLTVRRFFHMGQNYGLDEGILRDLGTDGLLERQMSTLSGGQFQRVCLARALMHEPDFLVLDEPVQGVDYAGELEIYQLISKIRETKKCGILLISHDLHIVMGESDRVVCLDRHVCCSGTPEKVVSNPEYERLFGAGAVQAFGLYKHAHDHKHGPEGEVITLDNETHDCGHDHGEDAQNDGQK